MLDAPNAVGNKSAIKSRKVLTPQVFVGQVSLRMIHRQIV